MGGIAMKKRKRSDYIDKKGQGKERKLNIDS